MCMDNATAAEKMYEWPNTEAGDNARASGPYISEPANGKPIPRDQPYCLRISKEHSRLLSHVARPTKAQKREGKAPLGHVESELINAREIVATATIQMQVAILEEFDFSAYERWHERFGSNQKTAPRPENYSKKSPTKRLETLYRVTGQPEWREHINAYQTVKNLRNKLAHEPAWVCDSPETALQVFITCQGVAYFIEKILTGLPPDNVKQHRTAIWLRRVSEHRDVKSFADVD